MMTFGKNFMKKGGKRTSVHGDSFSINQNRRRNFSNVVEGLDLSIRVNGVCSHVGASGLLRAASLKIKATNPKLQEDIRENTRRFEEFKRQMMEYEKRQRLAEKKLEQQQIAREIADVQKNIDQLREQIELQEKTQQSTFVSFVHPESSIIVEHPFYYHVHPDYRKMLLWGQYTLDMLSPELEKYVRQVPVDLSNLSKDDLALVPEDQRENLVTLERLRAGYLLMIEDCKKYFKLTVVDKVIDFRIEGNKYVAIVERSGKVERLENGVRQKGDVVFEGTRQERLFSQLERSTYVTALDLLYAGPARYSILSHPGFFGGGLTTLWMSWIAQQRQRLRNPNFGLRDFEKMGVFAIMPFPRNLEGRNKNIKVPRELQFIIPPLDPNDANALKPMEPTEVLALEDSDPKKKALMKYLRENGMLGKDDKPEIVKGEKIFFQGNEVKHIGHVVQMPPIHIKEILKLGKEHHYRKALDNYMETHKVTLEELEKEKDNYICFEKTSDSSVANILHVGPVVTGFGFESRYSLKEQLLKSELLDFRKTLKAGLIKNVKVAEGLRKDLEKIGTLEAAAVDKLVKNLLKDEVARKMINKALKRHRYADVLYPPKWGTSTANHPMGNHVQGINVNLFRIIAVWAQANKIPRKILEDIQEKVFWQGNDLNLTSDQKPFVVRYMRYKGTMVPKGFFEQLEKNTKNKAITTPEALLKEYEKAYKETYKPKDDQEKPEVRAEKAKNFAKNLLTLDQGLKLILEMELAKEKRELENSKLKPK